MLTAKKFANDLRAEKADEKNLRITAVLLDDTVIQFRKDTEVDEVNHQFRIFQFGEPPDESPDTIGNYETLTEEL